MSIFLTPVCNFGYGWEYGFVEAETQYKSFVNGNVKAEIGLKVGLRGINVTLRGNELVSVAFI